jgi:rfaE bifunctional protein nucleotidyltransferase chain/domain
MLFSIQAKIISDPETLKATCNAYRSLGKTIILTTGAYDLLHEGHLKYLLQSRSYGDVLVVGINDDKFVLDLKGKGRPIYPENHRAFMVAGFGCVDHVSIFNNRLAIVDLVRPDVMVMSNTSHAAPNTPPRLKQKEMVEMFGGKVVILEEMSGYSTTKMIARLKEL